MNIELTREEALVLWDWLYRNSSRAEFFDDTAEQAVFWSMECLLEKELVESFCENYAEIMERARESVRKTAGF